MDTKTHQLIIKPNSAKTGCGKEVIAFYPMSNTAMLEQVGVDHIKVTVGTKGVNCEECKKKIKDEG